MAKERKKRNKKYNPNKSNEYINPLEYIGDPIKIYNLRLKETLINNNFTVKNLIFEGFRLYEQSYFYDQLSNDFNASNIRAWVEKEFDKLDNINTKKELDAILSRKIKIHWQIRDLLIQFIDELDVLTCAIKSRTMYAKIYNESIIRRNIRINLVARSMKKFLDVNSVSEAQNDCRIRLKHKELQLAKKEGKIAYFDETGDIIITDIGETIK